MGPTICDMLDAAVAAGPGDKAVRDDTGADWRYADLAAAVDAAARRLRELGVAPGDRVAILSENCATAIAFIFGAARIGAWAASINARQTPYEIDRILAHARPRAVALTVAASPDAEAHAARLGAKIEERAFGRVALCAPYPSAPEPDGEVAVLLYTTGTTGAPKGVMLTHANLRFTAETSARMRGMTPHDEIYGVLPMTHVFGLVSMMMGAIWARTPIRLAHRFSAKALHHALRDGVTILPAVPQMHALLMAHIDEDRLAKAQLRYVSSGGAPLDPVWKRKAERFYGVAVQNGYGLTETASGVSATANPPGDPDVSVGPPLQGVEIRIEAAGEDRAGEVLVRGPNIMRGYYNNPEESAAALCEGWLRTGDLGRIDAQGRLHILGRAKELIIHGGFNVYPPEVEAALNDHPLVVQSAVVGRRTAQGDEEVIAFVQPHPGAALEESALKEFVRARLTGYKRPSRIVLADALPAAPTGKVLKTRLLDHFADALAETA